MTTHHPPRILDASALVELFAGHRTIMQMMEDADGGRVFLLVPTLAISEAQAVIRAAPRMWDFVLGFRGIRAMDLTEHAAIEVGTLAAPKLRQAGRHAELLGPLMVAQVVYEAAAMNAVVVTSAPLAYEGHDVAVMTL